MDFAELMHLEPHGTDVYVGAGPRYPWGGLYGGQIVAQGLGAALATVDARFRVHSLHAYFIRKGDHDEPIRFEVDRLRNGRSFVTRRVVARQSVGAIFNMACSFQADEPGVEAQTARMPEVSGPEGLEEGSWSPMFQRSFVHHRAEVGRATAWLRMARPVGADERLHACALAYMSDDLPTDAVVAQHPDRDAVDAEGGFMAASLDHAIWFHRPFVAADSWHVHDFRCQGLLSSRGLATGQVFTSEGIHVATVSQEVLLRPPRD